ncbi:sodium/myo-inositol cotransporter 2 isoform X5 [Eublepharis macularius]|uniref:Sodium/myo-inositol cotransporter 2 n=1 Tax=Eublepharis macularius TaxID=481883 RepID=A0AA97K3X7_EUBMA|nr:sodium/myo-inositol cotransporter 2 isoform X5 [Eublepharis macularius]
MAVSSHLHCCWGYNHARIFAETVWWQKDTDLPSNSLLVYLYIHQNLSRHVRWGSIHPTGLALGSLLGRYWFVDNHGSLHCGRGPGSCDLHGHPADGYHAGFAKVGGLEDLQNRYFKAIASSYSGNGSCGLPRDDAFHIFRDPVTSDLPWPGVLVGMTIPSLWYWCTDQVIVQRSLAAKSLSHAKGGSLLASYLKVLPLFMMVLPGMISRILFPDLVACADRTACKEICGNPSGCSDIAYPKLVIELLPIGLRGLMMSVMIAALMSSLTSIFNSASTIFTMDLWRHFRPLSSEWELMIVGRVFVLLLVIVSILWIPLVQASQGGQLFIYIQTISSYLQPPVAVIFILGCFWKRTNEKGAFYGLLIGMVMGLIRMVLDFVYPQPWCDETDSRPAVVKYVHYLYFSMILGLATLIVVVVVSLWTAPPSEEMVSRLTWFTRKDVPAEKDPTASQSPSPKSSSGIHEACPPLTMQLSLSDGPENICHGKTSTLDGKKASKLMRLFLWVCGMDSREKDTPEIPIATKSEAATVQPKEAPWVKHVLNINLILCLSVGVFLWGYFA